MPLLTSLIKPSIENILSLDKFNSLDKFINNNEDLGKIVARVAKKELNESEKTKVLALQQIKTWVQNNDDIENVRTDDDFLLRFLRVKKFNVQLVQQMLLKYLNLKRVFPHITTHMDCLSPNMSRIFDDGYCVVSPNRDKHGRRVLIFNISKSKHHN